MLLAGLGAAGGRAQVTVTKGMREIASLDLTRFAAPPAGAGALFRQVLEADLARSGWFALGGGSGAEFALLGEAGVDGDRLAVRGEAYAAAERRALLSRSYAAAAAEARRLAHRVADDVVLALTGVKGMASARVLLVGSRTGHKEVYLCDADGYGLRQLTSDGTISQSPKWASDGQRFVYTSFRSQFPDVYLVDLRSGDRRCIARFPGLNSSAALSPDGRDVALILSRDGNPELYVMALTGGRLTRLTRTPRAAEASPSWSPDGRQIAFVSDVSGAPQVYLLDRAGGAPRRLTSRGAQNVDPDWGTRGWLVCSSLWGGQYQLSVIHPETREVRAVTPPDANYEDPSWLPDGRHVLCMRSQQYRSRIFVVDTQGGTCHPLLPESETGDWHAPDSSK